LDDFAQAGIALQENGKYLAIVLAAALLPLLEPTRNRTTGAKLA
jgi:hypothetical protein